MLSGARAGQGAGSRQGRLQTLGAERRQGAAAQPGAPAELVKRDQGRGGDHLLALELPHQAAVGIVLGAGEGAGQGRGGQRAEAAAVIEVQPAAAMQLLEHLMALAHLELQGHIAEGGGLRIELHQGPQAVMAIHHPQLTGGTAHQRGGLAAQITAPHS